ncbi:MAG: hypothetical protein US74_C0052G0003 [Parcubacteria group bacterium GW2011_GWA2_38_13]|nr:MAG: hypothetical protein US74_C0052G0003 [Parcubacteria group bacterium GW2011_GWA2_38_13]
MNPVRLEAKGAREACVIKDLGNNLYEFCFEEAWSDSVIGDVFEKNFVVFLKKNPNLKITCIYNLFQDRGLNNPYSHPKILVVTEEK